MFLPYFRLFTFSDLYWVCLSVFSCTVLFVSISQVIGCEDRFRNDLYCVGWGVKLYSNQNLPGLFFIRGFSLVLVSLCWRSRLCVMSLVDVSVVDHSTGVQRVSGGGGRPRVSAAESEHNQWPCSVPCVLIGEWLWDDVGRRCHWVGRQHSD